MQAVIPALRIGDYERAKGFYLDGLGFSLDWEHRFEPGFPVFVQITREGMTIYLTQHRGDCAPGGLVHFFVDDVDALHAEFVGRGVPIDQPPGDNLPGIRDMQIIDPDGNKLRWMTRAA